MRRGLRSPSSTSCRPLTVWCSVTHEVQTTHICKMIEYALVMARELNGVTVAAATAEAALSRASNLLRHAAEELEDERQACLGWEQV